MFFSDITIFVFGLILGVICTLLLKNKSNSILRGENQILNLKIKHQDELERERNKVIDAASSPLKEAFQDISNKSLKQNSENFLRLAEENLSKHQEISKSELKKRESAIQGLISPIEKELNKIQIQNSHLEQSRSQAYGGIKAQLQEMKMFETNRQLSLFSNIYFNKIKINYFIDEK